jgi:hypothetical protein
VLKAGAGAVERRSRKLPLAVAAPLALLVHERMFASAPDVLEV